MMYLNTLASLCLEYLFPSGCFLCGTMLTGTREILDGLCDDCARSFQIEKCERCSLCGRPLISEKEICLGCRNDGQGGKKRPAYDRLISLFPYTGRYQKLLWAFKYDKSAGAARFIADKFLETLKMMNTDCPVLVPVPPRPGKIWKTGWDQIDFLAGILRRKGPYPVSRCLVRLAQDTQKKLNREERRVNLLGKIRFAAGRGKAKAPSCCVLFDDVIATGSTMNACAAALKLAGAETVYGICLVYD